MFPLSRRTIAAVTLAPAVALALTACGSPAINTNYTPGAQPTAGSTMSASPTKGATSKASRSASAKASSHASATAQATRTTTAPGSHSSAPSGSHSSSGGSGGIHTVGPSSAVITVVPSTGLSDRQKVTIYGTHFKPGVSVIIVECVDYGSDTQQGNCTGGGLFGIPAGFKPAADGTFTRTFVVHKSFTGFDGNTRNTCSSSTPCIISVTEPSNNPTEEADAHIYFL